MSQDIKQRLICELDSRIARLQRHQECEDVVKSENPYEQMNEVMSKAIGLPLQKELEDIKRFVQNL